MFIFILLHITSGQQIIHTATPLYLSKNIWKNELAIVDQYTEYSPIIWFQVQSDQQCQFTSQEMHLKKMHTLDLIMNFSEKQFREYFQNGKLYNEIPQLLQAVSFKFGQIILTNDLLLIIITEDNGLLKVSQSIVLNVPVEVLLSPYFMHYYDNRLLIFFNQLTISIKISLKYDENIEPPTYSDIRFNTENIITIKSNKYLYILSKIGLHVYEIINDNLSLRNEMKNYYIKDIVLLDDQIYLLDSNKGITIYNLDLVQIRDSIFITGHKLAVFNKVILVAQWLPTNTQITDIQIQENSWDIIHKFQIIGKLSEILLYPDLSILNTEHGSFLYFHSIPTQYLKQTTLQRLKLPRMRQMFLTSINGLFNIKGITQHKFVYYQATLNIPNLKCISASDFYVSTQFLSSNCPLQGQLVDQKFCLQEINYIVSILTPVITSDYTVLLITILAFIFIILCLIICYSLKNYLRYYFFVKKSKLQIQELQDSDSSALASSINASGQAIQKI